jgi:hypothetical protein
MVGGRESNEQKDTYDEPKENPGYDNFRDEHAERIVPTHASFQSSPLSINVHLASLMNVWRVQVLTTRKPDKWNFCQKHFSGNACSIHFRVAH